MLDTLKEQFMDEWVIAHDCSLKEAREVLEEALQVSASKMENE